MSDERIKACFAEREIKVQSYDIDVVGIVSNIVYIRWLEDLRNHLLDVHYPFEDFLTNNQSPVLARTEIDYKFPLTIYDKPVGRVWIESLGTAKIVLGLEIVTDSKVHCKARQTCYVVDLETRRPIRVPAKFRELFEEAIVG